MIDQNAAQERRKDLRAGLVAATVVNVKRKRGARMVQPQDFFRPPRKAADYMTPAQGAQAMDRWAKGHNTAAAKRWGGGAG